jgi:hypothetical protein
MPPVNPQGSRGGLVAAVVVFTVLFVVATIFAIYYGVQDSKAEESNAQLLTRYRQVVQDLTTPDVTELEGEAKSDAGQLPEPTALAEAIMQRNHLRTMMLGANAALPTTPTDATSDAATATIYTDTMAKATKAVTDSNAVIGAGGAQFTATSLVQAVSNLTEVVKGLNQAAAQAVKDRDTARQQAARDSDAAKEALASATKAVADAKAAMQTQVDTANDTMKKAGDDLGAAKKTFDDEQHQSALALEAADKEHVRLTNEIDGLQKQVTGLSDKLTGRRADVIDPIIRRPDGKIVALGDATTVYINLGHGDHVVPGMTFEVYSSDAPLPRLGDGLAQDNLPQGKASIEVMKVLDNGAECHINRVTPGQQVLSGDPVLNLIYDRNIQPNFFVYGDFDISRSGHPSPAGADVVRRLVVQWGGKLDKSVDAETDFVVMGALPEIPVYSADDLKDPLKAQDLANAQRAAAEYEKVLQDAEKLNVPILNQDKFLFFTGFYDVALR